MLKVFISWKFKDWRIYLKKKKKKFFLFNICYPIYFPNSIVSYTVIILTCINSNYLSTPLILMAILQMGQLNSFSYKDKNESGTILNTKEYFVHIYVDFISFLDLVETSTSVKQDSLTSLYYIQYIYINLSLLLPPPHSLACAISHSLSLSQCQRRALISK